MNNNIHDDLILKIFIGNRNLPNTRRIQKVNKGLCPNIMLYLRNRYDDCDKDCKLSEIIYRIFYHQEKRNYCKTCGNKTKFSIKGYKFYKTEHLYNNFCCSNCAQNNKDTRNKIKNTCLELYGVINGGGSKQAIEKIKQTNLLRRGVTNNMLLNSFKEKRKETWFKNYGVDHPLKSKDIQEKIRQTCLVKYGSLWTCNNEISYLHRKQTNLQKYGYEYCQNNPNIINKINNSYKEKYGCSNIGGLTKIPNIKKEQEETLYIKYGVTNAFNIEGVREKAFKHCISKGRSSKYENLVYDKLLTVFDKEDIIRQYKEIRYPYFCDFYIKSIDTFIEYQGTWLHGEHPFNINLKEDKDKLNLWKSKNSKYYNQGIKCWTIYDPIKRNKAKKENIRYIEIYDMDKIDLQEIKQETNKKYLLYA